MKQPIRQPKQSRKTARSGRGVRGRRNGEREQRSSLDAIIRLDRSAIISIIVLYCVVHWAIRVLVAPVYTVEEAGQLLLSQSFQFGYEARQPPLLTWLYWAATRAGGLSPPVIFAVKYVLLLVGLVFYYLSARNILPGRVDRLAPRADGSVLVGVALGSGGAHILSAVTRDAVDALALAPGKPIWAVVQSVAVEGARGGGLPAALDD